MAILHPSFPDDSGSRTAVPAGAKVLKFPNAERAARDAGMTLEAYELYREALGNPQDAEERPDADRLVLEQTLTMIVRHPSGTDKAADGKFLTHEERQEGRFEEAKQHAFYFREWFLRVHKDNPAKAYVLMDRFVNGDDFNNLPPVPRGRILTDWTGAIGCAGMYARYVEMQEFIHGHIARLHELSHAADSETERGRIGASFIGLAINASELSWGLGDVDRGLQFCRSASAEALEIGGRRWEATARAHAAQMLVRLGRLDEAQKELERCPADCGASVQVRKELAAVELAIRRNEDDDAVLEKLTAIRPRQFDLAAWKQYLWGLVWSRRAGVVDLAERTGETPTGRYQAADREPQEVRHKRREEAWAKCVRGMERRLLRDIRACDNGKNGWENLVPLIESMALLSRTFREISKKREWALRAWAAYRNHFSSVPPESGFKPLTGTFARAAYRAASEAFPDDLDREPSEREARRLDGLYRDWEADRLNALEKELTARINVKRPFELFEIFQRDCGVSSALIAPLDPAPIEARSFGFSVAVKSYPGERENADDTLRLREYMERRKEIESSQTRAFRKTDARKKIVYDDRMIKDKILPQCRLDVWTPISLPISYEKYVTPSLCGTIIFINGLRYLVIADRGEKRLLPLTDDMKRRIEAFARHYVEFATSKQKEEEQEVTNAALMKSLTSQGSLAVEQVRLLGAPEDVLRRVAHEIGTFLTCGQAVQVGVVKAGVFAERTERFVTMVDELRHVYDKMCVRDKPLAEKAHELLSCLDLKDSMTARVAEVLLEICHNKDRETKKKAAPDQTAKLVPQEASDVAEAALEKLGTPVGGARWDAPRGITFDASRCEGTWVLADEETCEALLKVAVAAARTAPDGAHIYVSARREGGNVVLTVDAPLAPQCAHLAFRQEHFQLFGFRADSSTMADAGNKSDLSMGCEDLGTGLAWAQFILEERGGSIRVPPQPEGRAQVKLVLLAPLENP